MARIDSALMQQFAENPDRAFRLIIRTTGETTPHVGWCHANGMAINRQFKLTPALAVTAQGRDALKLSAQPWVTRVEVDAPVRG